MMMMMMKIVCGCLQENQWRQGWLLIRDNFNVFVHRLDEEALGRGLVLEKYGAWIFDQDTGILKDHIHGGDNHNQIHIKFKSITASSVCES